MVLLALRVDMAVEQLVVPVLLAMVMAVKELLKQLGVLVIILVHLDKEGQVALAVVDMVALVGAAGTVVLELYLIILVMMTAVAAVALAMYILHQLLLAIHPVVYLIRLII